MAHEEESRQFIRVRKVTREKKEEEPPVFLSSAKENEVSSGQSEGVLAKRIGKTCLYLLTFLSPLFFLPITATPVAIDKTLLSVILLSIAFITYLTRVIQTRSVIYPSGILSKAIAILIGAAALGTVFSRLPRISFYGNLTEPDSLISFVLYGLVFFLAFYFLEVGDIKRICILFVASVGVVTLLGIFHPSNIIHFPWGFTRQADFTPLVSMFSEAIFAAALLTAIFTLPLREYRRPVRFVLIASGALVLFHLALLNYWIIWMAIALFTTVIAAIRFAKNIPIGKCLVLVSLAVFAVLVSRHVPNWVSAPIEPRPSFSSTLAVVKGVGLGPRVIFGSGPGTFGYEYSLFRPAELNQTNFGGVRFNQGYNFLLTTFVNLGVVGLIAVLFLIFAFLRQVLRLGRDDGHGPIYAVVLFFMMSWFFYSASFTELLFTFFGLGLFAALSAPRRRVSFADFAQWPLFSAFIILVLMIAFSLALLFTVGQKYAAAVYYKKSLEALQRNDLPVALAGLHSATNLDGDTDEYWRKTSQALLIKAQDLITRRSSISDFQVQIQNTVLAAVQTAKRATEVNSLDSINWVNLANVYEGLAPVVEGTDKFAEEGYRKAAGLDPKNPETRVDIARVLFAGATDLRLKGASTSVWQAKFDETEKMLNESIRLKPDYAPAHFALAQLYISEGDVEKAIKKTQEISAANPFDQGIAFQFGSLYYQNNQIDMAQAEFERAVGLDQNYSNARYFLGLIYDRKGLKDQALEQFEKIAVLNPENSEVKSIIDNLRVKKAAFSGAPSSKPPEKRSKVPVAEPKKK